VETQLEDMTAWHLAYSYARLSVLNFTEGVAVSKKVNKEYTSAYVVEPSGSAVGVSMSAPYEDLE
jgi:hypothetical protein